MDPNQANDQIEAFAALVGSTQAELGKIDEAIIDGSSNLVAKKFDGKAVLMKEVQNVKQAVGVTGAPVQPEAPAPVPPPSVEIPPAGVHPQVQQPIAPAAPPPQLRLQPQPHPQPQPQGYGSELQIVLQKLVSIDDSIKELNNRIDSIEYFDKKVIDSLTRGLQSKVKQVTIKLDDIKNSK